MKTGMQEMAQVAEKLRARIAANYPGATSMPARPQPRCALCDDRQLLRLPEDHPDAGRLIPCPRCAPKSTRSIYGLTVAEQDYTWGNIAPYPLTMTSRDKTITTTAKRMADRLSEILVTPGQYIFISGGYGLGKTRLLKTAIAETLRAGKQAQYSNLADILADIRDAFDSSDPRDSALARYRRWVELPMLAIDEIDKIQSTEWARDRLFHLLNSRYEAAMSGETSTLLASNIAAREIDPAFASRINDGRALSILLSGADVRPAMERK